MGLKAFLKLLLLRLSLFHTGFFRFLRDSVGTPVGRTDTPVIPTETPIIAPTIPPSPDYTPASPDYSPASDSESDPSSDHIPPLPASLTIFIHRRKTTQY
ncbi:hypothetical protein Tco_0264868 [Tanacetum coccineum]